VRQKSVQNSEQNDSSVAGALGKIGNPKTIKPLISLLDTITAVYGIYGRTIGEVAATALEMIGTQEALDVVKKWRRARKKYL
jgi:hypothetical protein